jgi:hypothetical protein
MENNTATQRVIEKLNAGTLASQGLVAMCDAQSAVENESPEIVEAVSAGAWDWDQPAPLDAVVKAVKRIATVAMENNTATHMTLTLTKPSGRHIRLRCIDASEQVIFFARTRSNMDQIETRLHGTVGNELRKFGWDWAVTLFDADGDAASSRTISVQP